MDLGGRPTKYKEEYCDLVHEYLKCNIDSVDENGKLTVNLPTVGGFLDFLNEYIKDNLEDGEEYKPVKSEKTLYNWAENHDWFLQSLGKVVKEQEQRLLNCGLSGDYNSTIAKLVLSSNHGYKEKSDVTSNDQTITANAITFIDDEKES